MKDTSRLEVFQDLETGEYRVSRTELERLEQECAAELEAERLQELESRRLLRCLAG